MLKCKNCKININNRKPSQIKRSRNHFCSRNCAASYNNHKQPKRNTIRKCSINNCENIVQKWNYRRCTEHFSMTAYEIRQIKTKNLTLSNLRKKKLKNINGYIRYLNRSWNKDKQNKPCELCKYSTYTELCHIKPIKEFDENNTIGEINSPDNIIVLCPNHHKELDMNYICIT